MTVPAGHWLNRILAAAGELVLGNVCAGCEGEPGLLCASCRADLSGPARVARTAGPRLAFAAEYGGPARAAIVAHKEHGRLRLAAPLGDALAVSVAALLETPGGCGACGERPVALLPVPSPRVAVRRRGHDPMVRAARRAAVVLRRVGYQCAVVPGLRHVRTVADQVGLDPAARRANLSGALRLRRVAEPLLDGRCAVLVDDVVTTGATLEEASRALAAGYAEPCGAAVVASARPAQMGLIPGAGRAASR